MKKLLAVCATLILIHLGISAVSPFIIHEEVFPYLDDLQKTGFPSYIYSFANFDGAIYLKIARSGYLPLTQAFFPFYPKLIAFVTFITQSPLISGLIISWLSLLGALVCAVPVIKQIARPKNVPWFLFFILTFPTSFFFQSLYTESIFICLLFLGIWSIQHKKWVLAIACGYLIALTRFIGIFTTILFAGMILQQVSHEYPISIKHIWKFLKNTPTLIVVLLSPLAGFVTYSWYLFATTGNFLAFFTLQPLSNAGRSTSLVFPPQVMYRYLKIFLTAQWNLQYFIALIEFFIFIFVVGILILDAWKIYKNRYTQRFTRLGLNIFSFINLLLPTFTGTFTSLPRYALMSISVFLFLSEIENKSIKILILSLFSILHIILFLFFIQGYFVS